MVAMQTVLGIILGGGAGSRLYPLTKTRAKPAVPLGANYRLIDIPVSNCINSGVNKIYCMTQFNSASLNRHLASAYVRPMRCHCNHRLIRNWSSPFCERNQITVAPIFSGAMNSKPFFRQFQASARFVTAV